MLVRGDLSLQQYDDSRWVLSTSLGRHFVVNDRTAFLCETLRNSTSWEEARRQTCDELKVSMERDEFRLLVEEVLGKRGLLNGENEEERTASYLRFRQPILPPAVCGFMARIFPPVLFRSSVFWLLFAVGGFGVVGLIMYVSVQGAAIFAGSHYSLAPVLFVGAMLAHELGHIAACRAKRVSHGAIGFGIYFFYPVMYADITDVWQLPRSERLIANLSGIYGELLYVAILIGLYGVFRDGTYLLVASTVATSSAYQLNPFVRRDGYWVLSDALCIPNLVTKSKSVVLERGRRFSAILQGETRCFRDLTPTNIFLFAYGILNSAVIFIFVGLVATQYGEGLVYFPVTLFELVREVGTGTLTWSAVRVEYLLFAAVYTVAIRYIIAGGRSLLRRISLPASNAG